MNRLIGGNLEVDGQLYMFHHTALSAGYVKYKATMQECADAAEEYHGRFGDGYTVRTPNFNTFRYCYITYYIKQPDNQ